MSYVFGQNLGTTAYLLGDTKLTLGDVLVPGLSKPARLLNVPHVLKTVIISPAHAVGWAGELAFADDLFNTLFDLTTLSLDIILDHCLRVSRESQGSTDFLVMCAAPVSLHKVENGRCETLPPPMLTFVGDEAAHHIVVKHQPSEFEVGAAFSAVWVGDTEPTPLGRHRESLQNLIWEGDIPQRRWFHHVSGN